MTLAISGDITSLTGILVDLIYSGTGINGTDYVTGTAQATITAGLTGTTFTLTGINDIMVEGSESLVVEIS